MSELMFYAILDAVEWSPIDFVSISIKLWQIDAVFFRIAGACHALRGSYWAHCMKIDGWTLLLPMHWPYIVNICIEYVRKFWDVTQKKTSNTMENDLSQVESIFLIISCFPYTQHCRTINRKKLTEGTKDWKKNGSKYRKRARNTPKNNQKSREIAPKA